MPTVSIALSAFRVSLHHSVINIISRVWYHRVVEEHFGLFLGQIIYCFELNQRQFQAGVLPLQCRSHFLTVILASRLRPLRQFIQRNDILVFEDLFHIPGWIFFAGPPP